MADTDSSREASGAGTYDWTRIYKESVEEVDNEDAAASKDAPAKPAPSTASGELSGGPAIPWSRDRSKERRVFDLPTADKMAGIRRFHARGNLLFSEGQFRRAAIQFRAALIWYEYTFPEKKRGPDGQAALDARRVACLLNLAACEISLHAWKEAEATCSQALRAQPGSVKAMYRRALARRHRHDFEGAASDIAAAIAAQPGSGALLREQALLRLTVREHRRRERRVAERMLSGETETDGASRQTTPGPAERLHGLGDESGTQEEDRGGLTGEEEAPKPSGGAAEAADVANDGDDASDAGSSSAASVWTSGGDAVSGLTALGGDDDSVGGVSDWDGLGAGAAAAGDEADSGYGLATDWAAWTTGPDDDGGDEGLGGRPVRVDLSGAPKMSFEELLEASAAGRSAAILGKGVL